MSLSTEDLDNLIVATLEAETTSLFGQGDAIMAGIEAGHKARYVYGRFAYHKRCTLRTAYNRHKTRAIFDEQHRHPSLDWTFHYLCAQAADLRDPSSWEKAYQWLDRAVSLTSANQEYSTADLALDMKQAGNDPTADKPIYWLDKVEGRVLDVKGFTNGKTIISLHFDRAISLPLDNMLITIVQKAVKAVAVEVIIK